MNDVSNETADKIEVIENLFDEWDDIDKTSKEEITLDNNINSLAFNEEPILDNSINPLAFNEEPTLDTLDQTKEISSVDLEKLKELSAQMHELLDEPVEQVPDSSMNQTKGKTLTKATKIGRAMAENEIANAFVNCSILCFITAFIGSAWFMYIINHIN